jgi:hypothetical protein
MSFLSPWALLWLGTVPVLLWLWRLASTNRRITIPSLVPFEHLMRRAPIRRSRLVVNALFWLQLAALLLLTASLLQPVLFRRSAKTILIVVDTSASMGAQRVFEQATRKLRERIARAGAADFYVMSSAPVQLLTEQPRRSAGEVGDVLVHLQPTHLSGDLAAAAHLGHAVIGGPVDETWIVTDEPPAEPRAEHVEFISVQEPLPNVAIVGFDAYGGLCRTPAARVLVTVENFSEEAAAIQLFASQQGGRRVAEASAALDPRQRTTLSLSMPDALEGPVDLLLSGGGDALPLDNHATIMLRRPSAIPVAVVSEREEFRRLIERWLRACEGVRWSEGITTTDPTLVITDLPAALRLAQAGGVPPAEAAVEGIVQFAISHAPATTAASSARLVPAHWLVASDHPVGSYLRPVEAVSASLSSAAPAGSAGEPVIWGIMAGQQVPLVVAAEQEGRRSVSIAVDPTMSPASVPLVMVFFNSLRWLMGHAEMVQVGEPLTVSSLPRGRVRVERPDGVMEDLSHEGGAFHYDATLYAGRYRLTHGQTQRSWAVNFVDPLESNLLERRSSWRPLPHEVADAASPRRAPRPLAAPLALLVLALLLAEWWLYNRKRTVPGSGTF